MCVTSSTEGQIRTLPEPPIDGAMYVPRVSSAAHIDPPDVADVEGVAPAGSAQGEGESPGGRRWAGVLYVYVRTHDTPREHLRHAGRRPPYVPSASADSHVPAAGQRRGPTTPYLLLYCTV